MAKVCAHNYLRFPPSSMLAFMVPVEWRSSAGSVGVLSATLTVVFPHHNEQRQQPHPQQRQAGDQPSVQRAQGAQLLLLSPLLGRDRLKFLVKLLILVREIQVLLDFPGLGGFGCQRARVGSWRTQRLG